MFSLKIGGVHVSLLQFFLSSWIINNVFSSSTLRSLPLINTHTHTTYPYIPFLATCPQNRHKTNNSNNYIHLNSLRSSTSSQQHFKPTPGPSQNVAESPKSGTKPLTHNFGGFYLVLVFSPWANSLVQPSTGMCTLSIRFESARLTRRGMGHWRGVGI